MLHQGKLSQHQRVSWWQAIYRCMALAALVHSDAYPLLPVEASELSFHEALSPCNYNHASLNSATKRKSCHQRCGGTVARRPTFLPRATSPTIHVLRHLMNGIEMESIESMSRGGHSSDLEDEDDVDDDEYESDDDDQDTDNEDDSDDEVEESSGDEFDSDEEATDNTGSQIADNDFYYFLFIDSNVNG